VAGYSEVSRVVDLVACQDGAIVAESSSSERPAVATARGRDGRHAPHQPHAVKAVSRFKMLLTMIRSERDRRIGDRGESDVPEGGRAARSRFGSRLPMYSEPSGTPLSLRERRRP